LDMTDSTLRLSDARTNELRCAHEWFELRAKEMGVATAVRCAGSETSYEALNRAVNYWTRLLHERGVGPEVLVGIYGKRSAHTIAAMLAILNAGGGYVPLDAGYPLTHLYEIISQARISIVLTTPDAMDIEWPREVDVLRVDVSALAADAVDVQVSGGACLDNVAAVIFTSGSQGAPKAVVLTHRAIAQRIARRVTYAAREAPCQKASLAVVAHIGDLLLPLLHGCSVVIVPDEAVENVLELAKVLERHSTRTVMLVPSQLRAVLDSMEAVARLGGVERLIVSGEIVTPELVRRLKTKLPRVQVWNAYGLSETCGGISMQEIEAEGRHMVGRPLRTTDVYVLTPDLSPAGPGVQGEVYIGGSQLARGYLARPALTAERFVPNPFAQSGERMYRTGDLGRLTADDALEILGREDQEVKIRGRRVNLPEVEFALERHPAVNQAVVLLDRTSNDDARLRACIATLEACTASSIRSHLRSILPPHMIPSLYEFFDDGLPSLANGKIDRQQLARRVAANSRRLTNANIEGSGPAASLALLWGQLLDVEDIDPDDNFFELGGDSAVAMRVLARVVDTWQVDVEIHDLLVCPTLSAFTRLIEERIDSRGQHA